MPDGPSLSEGSVFQLGQPEEVRRAYRTAMGLEACAGKRGVESPSAAADLCMLQSKWLPGKRVKSPVSRITLRDCELESMGMTHMAGCKVDIRAGSGLARSQDGDANEHPRSQDGGAKQC